MIDFEGFAFSNFEDAAKSWNSHNQLFLESFLGICKLWLYNLLAREFYYAKPGYRGFKASQRPPVSFQRTPWEPPSLKGRNGPALVTGRLRLPGGQRPGLVAPPHTRHDNTLKHDIVHMTYVIK